MAHTWRGIYAIVVTPFKNDGALDDAGLARTVRFCLDAGVHGLVGPANASEFSTLSDSERQRWIEVVVGEAGGAVPMIASVTSGHAVPAAALASFAAGVGADGLMAMPPRLGNPGPEECYQYYQALDGAVDIPICVQNYGPPVGTPMAATLLARMCRELENVCYIKEETLPEPRQLSATLAAAGDDCLGIFGGQGGIYLLDEFARGAAGNMPGCHTVDVLVRLWDLLEAGQAAAARQLFNQLLPLMNFERLYGVAVYKEVLHRRGIIDSTMRRAAGAGFDEYDRREFEQVFAGVEGLFSR